MYQLVNVILAIDKVKVKVKSQNTLIFTRIDHAVYSGFEWCPYIHSMTIYTSKGEEIQTWRFVLEASQNIASITVN